MFTERSIRFKENPIDSLNYSNQKQNKCYFCLSKKAAYFLQNNSHSSNNRCWEYTSPFNDFILQLSLSVNNHLH